MKKTIRFIYILLSLLYSMAVSGQVQIDSIVVSDVSCNGGSDGSITVYVSGGQPPYTYDWEGDAYDEISSNHYSTISGLTASSFPNPIYYVFVLDSADPQTSDASSIIHLGEPDPIVITEFIDNISCNGGNDGSIDITVTGGNPPYTYSWSNGESTEDISDLTAGNYSVNITDSKGCTEQGNYELTQPAAISLTNIISHVDCFGDGDGAIDITVLGGTPPYDYLWSTGATTEDIGSLNGGDYSVTVTDANGCTGTGNYTVNEPAQALALSEIISHIDCNGDGDGAIDITVSGGTSGYTFLWSNGATTEDISGVNGGNYSVTVTDAHGCQIIGNYIINEPAPLTISETITDLLCNGDGNGKISIKITGGTAPYTYLWNNGETTKNISSLDGGDYSVTVTDDYGCQETGNYTVIEPEPILITESITNVLCNGDGDGAIDITVTGGTSPYTFLWDNGAITEDISSLNGGSYSVTVTDINGCTGAAGYTVNEPAAPLSLSETISHIDCNGDGDGAIDITVAGGTTGYTFLWSNGETTEDISGVAGGDYSLTVTDDHGCQIVGNYTINEPAALSITETITHLLCNGDGNGVIDIEVTGGTSPYSYSWSNGATSQDISSLDGGTYSVTVTDSKGCQETGNFTVIEPETILITETITDVLCNGNGDGAIDITVTGGTSPYTFLWDNGAITEDISSLNGDSYSVTITDINGCTGAANYTVNEPAAPLSLSETISHIDCKGDGNGAIDITVAGGTTAYTFLWSNGETTEDISGVNGGEYSLTVTDAHGCQIIGNYTINEPEGMVLTENITDILCKGDGTGAIDITVTGGTPAYTYLWSNGETTEDLTAVNGGSYSVTVTDGGGCSTAGNYNVGEPAAALRIDFETARDIICYGQNNGEINISASGGTPGYTYSINGGGTYPYNNGNISNLGEGSYAVAVKDTNGCIASGSTLSITEPTELGFSTTVTDATCNSSSNDGGISISGTGGTPAYEYSVDGGLSWQSGASFSQLFSGAYSVSIRDNNSCLHTSTVVVNSMYTVTAEAGTDKGICPNEIITLDGSAPNDAGGSAFEWWPATGLDQVNIANPLASPTVSTTYYLKVTEGTCNDIDSVYIQVFDLPQVYAGEDTSVFKGSSIILNASEGFSSYLWAPGSSILGTADQKEVEARPEFSTLYKVLGTTEDGCISSDSVLINVIEEFAIPSGFTPNGDMVNDTWVIDNAYLFPHIELRVVDRYGHVMFYSKGYGNGIEWDGTNGGKELPIGTYYYVIILNDGGNTPPMTGPITIIR